MPKVDKFKTGDALTAEWVNKVGKYVENLQITGSNGIQVRKIDNGFNVGFAGEAGNQAGRFITYEHPSDDNYPYGSQLYRAYPADFEGGPPDDEDDPAYVYIHMLTGGEVEEDTQILAWKIKGEWYSFWGTGLRIEYAKNGGVLPNFNVEPQGVGTLTNSLWTETEGTRDFYCHGTPIPQNWKMLLIGQEGDSYSHLLWVQPTNCYATLTSDITPLGSGTGNIIHYPLGQSAPTNVTNGSNVTIYDVQSLGATSGQKVKVSFHGKWILDSVGCA